MVYFKCPRCGYLATRKCNLKSHLNRKNTCFPTLEDIPVEDIKDIYDKDLFNKFKESGYKDSKPIFIVGMPRSGTTLIEQIISSHSEVFGADEIEFIPNLLKKYFKNHDLRLFFSDETFTNQDQLKKIGSEYQENIKIISNNSNRSTDKLPNNFQSIGFKLSDMATQIEAAKHLVYNAAYLKDHGKSIIKEAAMAKLFTSELAMNITTEAIQIHGGYGYIREYNVERFFRDAKILEIGEGTSEIQRIIISREILKSFNT